ncbi:MAG: ABC transporter permease subunit, partial [Alphaproteobacteria bacterium]|nr:ABC transporter permease subunit [Alphaproteobacteria bacterium]
MVVVGASFDGGKPVAGRAFLQFPPSELSFQWYAAIQPRLFDALWVSVGVAVTAALVGTIVGVPAALGIVRGHLPGKTLIAALFRAPLQIPFIVIGIAFLQTYYLISDVTGLGLTGTFPGLALGHVFVATPYVIGSVGAILQSFDHGLEEAALSLGASRWRTFRRVTLPIIMPGIYAGALFAFMVSFGDVPISLFLADRNLPFHGIRLRRCGAGDLVVDRGSVVGRPLAHPKTRRLGRAAQNRRQRLTNGNEYLTHDRRRSIMKSHFLRSAAAVVLAGAVTASFAVGASAQMFDGVTLTVGTFGGSWKDRICGYICPKFEAEGGKIEFVTGNPRILLSRV